MHVRGYQLGAEGGVAHIRGSPLSIECSDPWEQRTLVGAAPPKRSGATLASLGDDLVVFGGDESLAAVCHAPQSTAAAAADEAAAACAQQPAWQWFPTAEAECPPARKGHAMAAAPGSGRLLVRAMCWLWSPIWKRPFEGFCAATVLAPLL